MSKYFFVISLLFLVGCSSSDSIYRIKTKSGQFYYSEDRPVLKEESHRYQVKDLDNNLHYFDQDDIYQIESFHPPE